MDPETPGHFADIVALAQGVFTQVDSVIDSTPERAILRLQARYGLYTVYITELFSDCIRKYRYYILRRDWVAAGFDNAPDPRALRLKYGRISTAHAGECIPHLHRDNKNRLLLTEEMTFTAFVDWLQANISLAEPT